MDARYWHRMGIQASERTAPAVETISVRECPVLVQCRYPFKPNVGETLVIMVNAVSNYVLKRLAVRSNVSVGTNFHAGPGSVIWAPRRLEIGNDVYVGKHVTIQVDGIIGDGTLFANGSGLVGKRDHDYNQIGTPVRKSRWVGEHHELSTPAKVGSDVWIGFNSIVYSGLTIGDSVVVAAGSVVTKDIPSNSIVAGSPARVIRRRFTSEEFEEHWRLLTAQGIRRMTLDEISEGDGR